MNTPKLTFTIFRHAYSDASKTTIAPIEVGKYQIAHINGMQEYLSEDNDVTNIINYLEKDIVDFMNKK